MLLKHFTFHLLIAAAAHASGAANVGTPLPRYAAQLEKFSNYESIADGQMRLRVSVATDSLSSERNVRIGDLILCSSSACYRARTSGYVNIINTSDGAASVIADAVMPAAVKISDVFFTEIGSAASVMGGHLVLKTPLVMDREFPGAELLIAVRKQQLKGQALYMPIQAASAFSHPDNSLVYYLPALQTVAKLPMGGLLTIPANALTEPQVFNVSEATVGDMYPQVDIYPYLALNKPATIEVSPIPGGTSAHEMIVPVGTPAQKLELAKPNSHPAKKARLTISRAGLIQTDVLEDAALGAPQAAAGGIISNASATCANFLAQPLVLGTLNFQLLQTGVVKINYCEKIKPYVHMVYINMADERIQFSIPYSSSTNGSGNGPYLYLKRLNEFMGTPSIALINGFTWESDRGFFEGDQGKALGIVRANGRALGDNIVLGGPIAQIAVPLGINS